MRKVEWSYSTCKPHFVLPLKVKQLPGVPSPMSWWGKWSRLVVLPTKSRMNPPHISLLYKLCPIFVVASSTHHSEKTVMRSNGLAPDMWIFYAKYFWKSFLFRLLIAEIELIIQKFSQVFWYICQKYLIRNYTFCGWLTSSWTDVFLSRR